MRIWSRILILSLAAYFAGCGQQKPATPLETFKTYTKAIKQKDTTTMKLLLSDATMKMHEKEAKAQGVTLDDIVKRETPGVIGARPADVTGGGIEDERLREHPRQHDAHVVTVELQIAAGLVE